MTNEQILNNPQVAAFLANFSRYCGAPKSVFEGQFLVAVEAVLSEAVAPEMESSSGGEIRIGVYADSGKIDTIVLPTPPPQSPNSLWGKEVCWTELDEAAQLGPIVLLMPPPQSPTEP